jgi:hypothetical protein
MLSSLDEGLANVSTALKEAGNMFQDTLFIVTTDNGGPTTECRVRGFHHGSCCVRVSFIGLRLL